MSSVHQLAKIIKGNRQANTDWGKGSNGRERLNICEQCDVTVINTWFEMP